MPALEVQTFPLPADDEYPLHITAKRYRPSPASKGKEVVQNDDAPTLIVLHSTSFHKETWEPCLEAMFQLAGAKGQQFREAWAIESPNHGETAPLNTVAFTTTEYAAQCACFAFCRDSSANIPPVGCHGYAKAVYRFLTKGPVSFSSARLIGVGHSLGANTMYALPFMFAREKPD